MVRVLKFFEKTAVVALAVIAVIGLALWIAIGPLLQALDGSLAVAGGIATGVTVVVTFIEWLARR